MSWEASRSQVAVPSGVEVCFGSFAFADDPGDSLLTVPEFVVGRRGDRTWLTTVSRGSLDQHATITVAEQPRSPIGLSFADDNGRRIEMQHVAHATRREFQKLGKRWGGFDGVLR